MVRNQSDWQKHFKIDIIYLDGIIPFHDEGSQLGTNSRIISWAYVLVPKYPKMKKK